MPQPQEARETSRRKSERRIIDNRKSQHVFGSEQWTKEIMKHYVRWPKEEQRNHDRRVQERRDNDRRLISISAPAFRVLAKKGAALLSDEEKAMLMSLPLLSDENISKMKRKRY